VTTLLLTDIPPCSNLTAGLVTAQMCRAILPDPVAVFCVLNPGLRPEPYPDLAALPARTLRKPSESAVRRLGPLPLGAPLAAAVELRKRLFDAPRLGREAVAFGREVGARRLWCVLQGQTMVRLARRVSRKLGVPLHAHIWDPFSWWQRAHGTDALNAALDRRALDAALRGAASVASASWAMTEHLAHAYGVPGEPVIAALDRGLARATGPRAAEGRFVLAMAGQFYADREWAALLAALGAAGWRVAGREAALLTFGAAAPPGEIPPGRLDHRGWQPQAEVVRVIAEEADAAFCPYPFAPEMEEVARLSFPSKLPTFFAAGRPVLFLGPPYASPADYLRRTGAGLVVDEVATLPAALERLAGDATLQAALAEGARRAFLTDFTLEVQRAAVRRFLRLSPEAPATPAPA